MGLIEAQLRAEILALRRSNSQLSRRVSQLQGLLGELQPLWLEAPPDVQEQVQLALTAQTPRAGVCSAVLGPTDEDSPEPADNHVPKASVREVIHSWPPAPQVSHRSGRPSYGSMPATFRTNHDEPVRTARSGGMLSGRLPGSPEQPREDSDSDDDQDDEEEEEQCQEAKEQGEAQQADSSPSRATEDATPTAKMNLSLSLGRRPVPQIAGLAKVAGNVAPTTEEPPKPSPSPENHTPPGTARHRLDSDDDSACSGSPDGEVRLGEISVSGEQYRHVLGSWQDENEGRMALEREVIRLTARTEAKLIQAPIPAVSKLEEALLKQESAQNDLSKCLAEMNREMGWHGINSW